MALNSDGPKVLVDVVVSSLSLGTSCCVVLSVELHCPVMCCIVRWIAMYYDVLYSTVEL